MAAIKRIKQKFWRSVVILSMMSFTILFVPLTIQEQVEDTFWPLAIAILFWMLAILGYGAIFSAGKMRKKFLTKRFGKDIQMNLKPGAFSFFSNPTAKTMDIILLLAILLLIVVSLTPLKEAYLMVILFSLFTWAVNMHCLFNSRTFRITKYKIKRGRMA